MNKLRHIVTNWLTRHLLKAMTVDDILLISGKEASIGGHQLSKEEILNLKEEAQNFRESALYRFLIKEIKYKATLQRYDAAKTADDMIFGKAMLYNFDLVARFIRNISSL